MNLSKLDPLEDVQRSARKCPVDNRSQLKNERYCQVGSENVAADHVILSYHETTLPQFWKSHLELVGCQKKVDEPKHVEKLDVSIVCESIAYVAWFTIFNGSPRFRLLWVLYTIVDRIWKLEEDKVVDQHEQSPQEVDSKHS